MLRVKINVFLDISLRYYAFDCLALSRPQIFLVCPLLSTVIILFDAIITTNWRWSLGGNTPLRVLGSRLLWVFPCFNYLVSSYEVIVIAMYVIYSSRYDIRGSYYPRPCPWLVCMWTLCGGWCLREPLLAPYPPPSLPCRPIWYRAASTTQLICIKTRGSLNLWSKCQTVIEFH